LACQLVGTNDRGGIILSGGGLNCFVHFAPIGLLQGSSRTVGIDFAFFMASSALKVKPGENVPSEARITAPSIIAKGIKTMSVAWSRVHAVSVVSNARKLE
jgi:hypothetical protein